MINEAYLNWPETSPYYVALADKKTQDTPTQASLEQGLQAWVCTPGQRAGFLKRLTNLYLD